MNEKIGRLVVNIALTVGLLVKINLRIDIRRMEYIGRRFIKSQNTMRALIPLASFWHFRDPALGMG